jgi:hypothetical protein
MSTAVHSPDLRITDPERTDEESSALAGWYPALDPWRDRYWNGSSWTDRYRDRGTAADLPPQPSPTGALAPQSRDGVASWVLALSTAAALVVGVLVGGAASLVGVTRAGAVIVASTVAAEQAQKRADALQERLDALAESPESRRLPWFGTSG